MAGAGPSHGAMKRLFDPANFKKKQKTAMGVAPAGGPKIKHEKPRLFTKKNKEY